LLRGFAGVVNVVSYAFDVALEHGAGKDVRSKVAVAAFATAERDRDVKAERHRD
jgi:hypothetical protein